MRQTILIKLTIFVVSILISNHTLAYEEAFAKTPVDKIEVRTLPPARLLLAESDGIYFQESNNLFKKLFNFIKDNDIAMTIPVEGELEMAGMRFYLGKDVPQNLSDTESVKVVTYPARKVVSLGARGRYTEENVTLAYKQLKEWLNANTAWEADGKPYAVYWNSPFTLWFLKRFEIHIPIKRKSYVQDSPVNLFVNRNQESFIL